MDQQAVTDRLGSERTSLQILYLSPVYPSVYLSSICLLIPSFVQSSFLSVCHICISLFISRFSYVNIKLSIWHF
jgi:hypothetical protein